MEYRLLAMALVAASVAPMASAGVVGDGFLVQGRLDRLSTGTHLVCDDSVNADSNVGHFDQLATSNCSVGNEYFSAIFEYNNPLYLSHRQDTSFLSNIHPQQSNSLAVHHAERAPIHTHDGNYGFTTDMVWNESFGHNAEQHIHYPTNGVLCPIHAQYMRWSAPPTPLLLHPGIRVCWQDGHLHVAQLQLSPQFLRLWEMILP